MGTAVTHNVVKNGAIAAPQNSYKKLCLIQVL